MEKQIIVLGSLNYGLPMEDFGNTVSVHNPNADWGNASAVVFTGGEDLNPDTYKDPNIASFFSVNRDKVEILWYEKAIKMKIPMIGICRGLQFAAAMTGGKLVQHADHSEWRGEHLVHTYDGKTYYTNSLHHQMVAPKKGTYELLGWTERMSANYIASDEALTMFNDAFGGTKEPEILYFKEPRFLGVQWHPEMMDQKSPAVLHFKSLLKKYIF